MNRRTLNNDKLGVKDFITMAIMVVLIFVIYAVVGTPFGMTVLGNLFIHGVCAIPWGIIIMLLYTKVNKKGVALFTGLLIALLLLMVFWGISLFIAIGAVIAELVWNKLDRKKFATMMVCFDIQIVAWYLGLTVPLIFMKDIYLAANPGYAELFQGVYELAIGPLFYVGLASAIVGPIIGSCLGKVLLQKHFKKAGIV